MVWVSFMGSLCHYKSFIYLFLVWLNFHNLNAALRVPGWARTSIQVKKKLFENILIVKIHFVKSQGIYLESVLVSALNGWSSEKMHEILLCLKFEAVLDVKWKSFLVCLIKYFDVDTHGAFDSGSVYFVSECQGHTYK